MNVNKIKLNIDRLYELDKLIIKYDKFAIQLCNKEIIPKSIILNYTTDKKEKKNILDADGSLITEENNQPVYSMFSFYSQPKDTAPKFDTFEIETDDVLMIQLLGLKLQKMHDERKSIINFLDKKGVKI